MRWKKKKITRIRTRDMTDTYAERGRTSHAVRSNSKPELAATALPQLRMVGWGLWIQKGKFLKQDGAGIALGKQHIHYLLNARTCLFWHGSGNP